MPYGYDGLNRLLSAQESGATANSYAYSYDLAGNRTDGGRTYNAANQVTGWNYDAAGNLTSDGTTSYTYDALSRVVSYTASGTTTRSTQDLAAPLSQVLRSSGTGYVYVNEQMYTRRCGGISRPEQVACPNGHRDERRRAPLGAARNPKPPQPPCNRAGINGAAYPPWASLATVSGTTRATSKTSDRTRCYNLDIRRRVHSTC